MNRELATVLTASLVIAVSGIAFALSPGDRAGVQETPGQAIGQAANTQVAVPAAAVAVPEAIEDDAVDEGQNDADAQPLAPSQDAEPAAQQAAATDKGSAPGQTPQPVTGAFGIPLGERFEPAMVAKVLSEEKKTYRGPNKQEAMGTLYRVEPRVPNTLFNTYAVATTADGVIYLIRGDQKPTQQVQACQAPKTLAAFLESKYGKPREKGPGGEWFTFRDQTRPLFRGVRVHATRCARGIYSIVYSDEAARLQAPTPRPEPSESSGL